MRTWIALTLLTCALALPAAAQDYPKAEVFGGYQYTRLEGFNGNGWNVAVNGNFNHWFGVTGDFSGAYKSESGVSLRNYTYTFGPVFSVRSHEAFTPYVHALFGGFHASAGISNFSVSQNGFAMLFGGGVDIKLSERFALRAIQADWMSLHAQGEFSNSNARISTGLVVRF